MSRLKRVPVVYLAGGMRSNWQNVVKEALRKAQLPVIFIDPREHGCADEQKYTSWDLEGVRRADIVFAYLEKDNPNGAGLALEIGFAKALNESSVAVKKKILYVEDAGFQFSRYFGMARVCSDIRKHTLKDGILQLQQLIAEFNL